ncbi:MAG: methyl-accepting chemotaxis protein [Maricaulaceae bacterium]
MAAERIVSRKPVGLSLSSVKARLGLAIAAAVFAVVALGGFALYTETQLARQTEKLYRHPYAVGTAVRDVQTGVVALHRSMKDVALSRDAEQLNAAVTAVAEQEAEILRRFDLIRERFLGDPQMVETAYRRIVEWRPIRGEVIASTRSGDRAAAADITRARGAEHLAKIFQSVDALRAFADAKAETFKANSDRLKARSLFATLLAIAMAVGLAAAILIWTGRSILRAITGLSGEALRLADGDLQAEVAGQARRDEFAPLAQALEVLRTRSIERARLANVEDLVAEQARRRERTEKLIADFRSEASATLDALSEQRAGLETMAERLTGAAQTARDDAGGARDSTQNVAAQVRAVAEAVQDMSRSIEEIAARAGEARETANAATGQAHTTRSRFEHLRGSIRGVETVSTLIREITEQTNLLALNATIEAARAGDAGKGFAVVAQEVKTLAGQTADATQSITERITDIQTTAASAAEGFDAILEMIEAVTTAASAIAGAVEEQDAVTRSITQSAQDASQSTASARDNVVRLGAVVAQSSDAAEQTQTAADAVSKTAQTLRGVTQTFLDEVAAV